MVVAQAAMREHVRPALTDRGQVLRVFGEQLKHHDSAPPVEAIPLPHRVKRRKTRRERSRSGWDQESTNFKHHCFHCPHLQTGVPRGDPSSFGHNPRPHRLLSSAHPSSSQKLGPVVGGGGWMITDGRLTGHHGLFKHKVKSVDIGRLLSQGNRQKGQEESGDRGEGTEKARTGERGERAKIKKKGARGVVGERREGGGIGERIADSKCTKISSSNLYLFLSSSSSSLAPSPDRNLDPLDSSNLPEASNRHGQDGDRKGCGCGGQRREERGNKELQLPPLSTATNPLTYQPETPSPPDTEWQGVAVQSQQQRAEQRGGGKAAQEDTEGQDSWCLETGVLQTQGTGHSGKRKTVPGESERNQRKVRKSVRSCEPRDGARGGQPAHMKNDTQTPDASCPPLPQISEIRPQGECKGGARAVGAAVAAVADRLCQSLDPRPLHRGRNLVAEIRARLQRALWDQYGPTLRLHLLRVRQRLGYTGPSSPCPLAGGSEASPDSPPSHRYPVCKRRRKQPFPQRVQSQTGEGEPWEPSPSAVHSGNPSGGLWRSLVTAPFPSFSSSPPFFMDFRPASPSSPLLFCPTTSWGEAGYLSVALPLGEQTETGLHVIPHLLSDCPRHHKLSHTHLQPAPPSSPLPQRKPLEHSVLGGQWLVPRPGSDIPGERGGYRSPPVLSSHYLHPPLTQIQNLYLQTSLSSKFLPPRNHRLPMTYYPPSHLLEGTFCPPPLPLDLDPHPPSPQPWSFPRMRLY